MRGKGWGQKHSTVDYVWEHPFACLFNYHFMVMMELIRRGYNVDPNWKRPQYRGKNTEPLETGLRISDMYRYPEHNDEYLTECLDNLLNKGIDLRGVFRTT
jgi:uncharacterized protein (TIGR02328 family)